MLGGGFMNRGFIGALCLSVTFALLAGCSGSQPPIGAPGAAQSALVPGTGGPALTHKTGVVETVLYSFGSHALDGQWPRAGLINVNGTLYGATFAGGTHRRGRICGGNDGCGAVFSVTPSGTETVLYGLFAGGPHGANPAAALISFKGKLYGTTYYGGVNECPSGSGCGTVFSITPTGSYHVLHRFNGSGGALPQAKLLSVNGTFYGTTAVGGATNCGNVNGCGTVFSITPTGSYQVLHRFTGGSDGDSPQAGLINVNGKFYGTTSGGGKYGRGTVFWITPSGSEKVLHAFTQSDGKNPQAGLNNVDGKLFGTTYDGGNHSQGTVFSITTSGTARVLYRFAGGSDGAHPSAGLISVNGKLYGTTESGGGTVCGEGCGTVFSISTDGAETVLHSFDGGTTADGAYPQAGLIYLDGTLYGTTGSGGANGNGTVYTITGF